jgi:hypothetical protein
VERNRIKAKEKLLEAVDLYLNKEDSVSAQVKRIEKFREDRTNAKRKKKREEKLAAKLELEEKLKSSKQEEPHPDTNLETKTEENGKKIELEKNIAEETKP